MDGKNYGSLSILQESKLPLVVQSKQIGADKSQWNSKWAGLRPLVGEKELETDDVFDPLP